MTVLVAYGSTGGSTAEIARWIAAELRAAGLDVALRPADEVTAVDEYRALVLGGAVYMAGWHGDARKFAKRFEGRFAGRPVWLFSSGPLDHTADESDLPPSPQVETAMRRLGARGHVTFGGRLSEDARGWLGLVSRRLAKEGHSGDFRNPARVRSWARDIAADLRSDQAAPVAGRAASRTST